MRRFLSAIFISFHLIGLQSTQLEIQNTSLVSSESEIEKEIKTLLPQSESIEFLQKINEGCANDVWLVNTEKNSYIFRWQKQKIEPGQFAKMIDICKKTEHSSISPSLINYDLIQQYLLLQYIPSEPWPLFETNPFAYLSTARALRQFHSCLDYQPCCSAEIEFLPFSLIANTGKALVNCENIPSHFSYALEKTEKIYQKLKPWLKQHAILCHGDFHAANVILEKTSFKPFIIDFDSIEPGHPFFDIAKFTLFLEKEQRLLLLSEYLGRKPMVEELEHFEIIDLSLLMLIATVRFNSIYEKQLEFGQESLLSKEEMEALLESPSPLPSFQTIPFKAPSLQSKQLGAIYALKEFLLRYAELSDSIASFDQNKVNY